MLAGVCGAFGRATNTDPVLWRVVLVVLTIFGGIGVLAYLVGWLCCRPRATPRRRSRRSRPRPVRHPHHPDHHRRRHRAPRRRRVHLGAVPGRPAARGRRCSVARCCCSCATAAGPRPVGAGRAGCHCGRPHRPAGRRRRRTRRDQRRRADAGRADRARAAGVRSAAVRPARTVRAAATTAAAGVPTAARPTAEAAEGALAAGPAHLLGRAGRRRPRRPRRPGRRSTCRPAPTSPPRWPSSASAWCSAPGSAGPAA